MPIQWKIDHGQRLVTVKTEGTVDLKDVETYLDDIVTKGAMPYAKLFDATSIAPVATDHDVMMLGARMRAYISTMEGGPLAIVVTSPDARLIVERYINLASGAERPVKVFEDAGIARRWLSDVS